MTLAGVEAKIDTESDTAITLTAANHSKAVLGSVTIVADSGAVTTLAKSWAYTPEPKIVKFAPVNGQIGTLITITGSNLRAGADKVTEVKLATGGPGPS